MTFKKKFLLLAGDHRYPEAYRGNWLGVFETKQEAKEEAVKKGFNNIHDRWYEIVDLEQYLYSQMDESELNR